MEPNHTNNVDYRLERSKSVYKPRMLSWFLQVVDVGSGKGYLSEYLARCSGVTVVGLDSQPMNTRGALNRKQKVFSSIQC